MGTVTERQGDILNAPPNTIIMHACNAQGVWGKGVAHHLKTRFPLAYQDYHAGCKKPLTSDINTEAHRRNLVGTCIFTSTKCGGDDPQSRIYVASLITSFHYGQRVDPPDKILSNTVRAIQSFRTQMHQIEQSNMKNGIRPIREIWSVKLNSGLFKVPWRRTKAILQESDLQVVVVSLSEDVEAPSRSEQSPVGGERQEFVKDDLQDTDSSDDHNGLTEGRIGTRNPDINTQKRPQGTPMATRSTRSYSSTRGVARGAVGKSTNHGRTGRSKKQKHTADWLRGLEGIIEQE